MSFVSTSIAVPATHAAAHATEARRRPRRQSTSEPMPTISSDGSTDAGTVTTLAIACSSGCQLACSNGTIDSTNVCVVAR